MSIGYTPEAFGLVLVLSFGAAIAFGLVWLIVKLVFRLAGRKDSGWALVVMFALVIALFLTASLAVDAIGAHDTAVVTSKQETLRVTRRGGWNRTAQFGVRTTSGGDAQQSMLSASTARYDTLAVGDTLEVRVLRYGGLSLIRDAENSTRTLLPWMWVVAGLLGIVLVVILWKLMPSVLLVGGLLMAIVVPLLQSARDQRHADDETAMTARATATVRQVTRVTVWHLSGQRSGGGRGPRAFNDFQLPQPYDVIELDFTPPGQRSSVLAVDAVDIEANATPLLPMGATVNVRFSPADPRDAHLDGRTRSWHWRDMRHVYSELSMVLALLVGLAIAAVWLRGRVKRAFTRR